MRSSEIPGSRRMPKDCGERIGTEMSFSSNLKNELCRARLDGNGAKNALLSGIVYSSGRLADGTVRVASESPDVVRLVFKLVKSGYDPNIRFNGDEQNPFSKKKIYEISFVSSPRFEENVLFSEDVFPFEASLGFFLRGVFLGVGSVTDPQKGYHLELVFKEEAKVRRIADLLRRNYGLNAKITGRKASHLCYLKEAENISDFLTVIGSVGSLLDYENKRAFKQVRNKINRVINCDTANINKTTDAAIVQVEAIRILQKADCLKKLGEKYIEIAELRLENPELSLTDLGQLADPKITKSGVNHRMKKILQEALRIKYADSQRWR